MITRSTWRRAARGAALAAILGGAVACTPVFRNHGYIPPEEDLEQIVVGVDTRDSVTELVGRPSSAGILTDGGYYYVRSRRRLQGPRPPREIDRQVLAISFDETGTVTNVERFGLERGRVVALSRRVTDTNVQGTTFLRQLFGSLGQLRAEDLLGDQ